MPRPNGLPLASSTLVVVRASIGLIAILRAVSTLAVKESIVVVLVVRPIKQDAGVVDG